MAFFPFLTLLGHFSGGRKTDTPIPPGKTAAVLPCPGPRAVFLPESGKKYVDFLEKGGIIEYVPNGGLAQLVRAHASHA